MVIHTDYNGSTWVDYNEHGYNGYQDPDIKRTDPATLENVTTEGLAEMCDGGAESRNAHDFVGAHRMLAALLIQSIGKDATKRAMWHIASHGGLDRASGVCSSDDAWSDVGLLEPWSDWSVDQVRNPLG
jgi:hypothetical protein